MCSSSPSVPQALVDEFKKQMTEEASDVEDWSDRLISAGSDKNKLAKVLFAVFRWSGMVVKGTALQKYVIDLGPANTRKLLESLNYSEIEEWKSAILNRDWARLITRRMYPTCFRGQYIVI